MKIKAQGNIAGIVPYLPGKPLDELEREYGVANPIKLASNENPWGPSPKVVRALRAELLGLHRYPDGSCYHLVRALAENVGLDPAEIVVGNGSNEVIELLVKAFVREGDEAITSHPSFLMYQKFVQIRNGVNNVVPLKDMSHDLEAMKLMISDKTRLIFLDNPNNPTGAAIAPIDLYQFLSDIPESVIVVLDEAYVDFMDKSLQVDIYSLIRNAAGRCPVVSVRTFSKAYGLAGLRIGYGLMSQDIADILHKVRQPFNVNQMAQAGALAALKDDEYFQRTVKLTRAGLDFLNGEVKRLGCTTFPSHANFFLIDVGGEAEKLYQAMLHKGVIIRSMKSHGFDNVIRVTIGTEEENRRFIKTFTECLDDLNYV